MSAERYRLLTSSVSVLSYYFVWCSKYRRKVLIDSISERIIELLYERSEALGCEITKLNVLPDQIHLILLAPPTLAPQHIINQLKGYTSRILRQEFPQLRSRLPSLWSRSFYVESIGIVSNELLQQYIDQQKGA